MVLLIIGLILGVVIGVVATLVLQTVFGSRSVVVSNIDMPGTTKVDDPGQVAVKTITIPRS